MKTIVILTTIEVLMIASLFALWYLTRQRSEAFTLSEGKAKNPASRIPLSDRDNSRWSFINAWQVAPQRDDRTPSLVKPMHGSGSASADRSTARRSHQRMYRQWSADRHE
jgi:hypothetical protein